MTKLFRVVAVLNKETGDYHAYMTNIPVERLSARIFPVCMVQDGRLRWYQKVLKSYYRMDQIDSENPDIIKSLDLWFPF